ncbi:HNH endonuclease signature motif containing protein, partial [Millisia brevis]|uniref:HNH endonuclease signature motif containing protein n=1 Tax=Millisia brevis TaxID=264148 RepID=UPI0012EE0127
AARLHRERGDHDRHVVIRPDRSIPGQSRITGTLPADRAAALNARIDAMAAAVHRDDGRTVAQRRADALIALAHDEPALTCQCPDCTPSTAAPSAAERPISRSGPADCAEGRSTADGRSSTPRPASPTAPKPTFHIIVSLATLLGANNSPAYLDGHGVIDPAVARELIAEATRSYIHTPHTPALPPGSPPGALRPGTPEPPATPPAAPAPGSNRYVPSRSVRALATAAELCCTFPGCTTPVHRTDLDHTTPYATGGATTPTNLKPLCRPHHRIKTFTPGWRDYQTPLGHIFFTTPTGHTFLGNAFTGRDLFTELRPPRARNITPAHTKVIRQRHTRAAAHHRVRDRYDAAHPPPF